MAAVVLLLGLATTVSPLRAQGPARRRIAALGPDESLRIRYLSAGCYHLLERRITVRGGRAASAAVSPPTRESVGMPRDRGGVVALSEFDVRRLDRLLAFYRRSGRPRDCVIKEDVTLVWMKGDDPQAIERFTDESCMAAQTAGVLTLRELVLRAGEQTR